MVDVIHLQKLVPDSLVCKQLFFKLLGVQRVGLVDRISQVGLSTIVEFLDLVDLVRVENVFVADLLEEPIHKLLTVRNRHANFYHLLKKKRALGLGASLSNPFVQVCIEIGFVQDRVNDVDGCVTVLLIAATSVTTTLLQQPRILDALLAEAELKHLNAPNQVLVDVSLRLQLALKLGNLRRHLALFEEPFSLLCKVRALHVLKGSNDLVELDHLATARSVRSPEHAVIVISKVVRHNSKLLAFFNLIY